MEIGLLGTISLLASMRNPFLSYPFLLLIISFVCRNNLTTAEFGTLVNVDRLIRGMILDIFAIISDGYIENGNNYGFYANPSPFSFVLV
jgi:hypothetical protein